MADRSTFEQCRPHPWHGLDTGSDAPRLVEAYIEITPLDAVKYEIDKVTGYLGMIPGHPSSMVIKEVYGAAHAQKVVAAAKDDYNARFRPVDGKG